MTPARSLVGTHIIGALLTATLATAGTGCGRSVPSLPAHKDFSGLAKNQRRTHQPAKVESVFVVPKAQTISADDRGVELFEMIAALEADGTLTINDVLYLGDQRAAFTFQKLSRGDVHLRSRQGRFDAHARFQPSNDPLVAFDSGYGVEVRVADAKTSLVFRPAYEAARYRPYRDHGVAPEPGADGFSPKDVPRNAKLDGDDGDDGRRGGFSDEGPNGEDGEPGRNGTELGEPGGHGGQGGRGADGRDGEPGADGGNGGHGGNGRDGAHAGPGAPGARGGPGPSLRIDVRPVYSKFYPDEALVFVRVESFDPAHRTPRGHRNYVLHRRQAFSIQSVGGKGGAGGPGGRGGKGGDAGDGGKGGDGGRGGPSQNGGLGGQGGDGGRGGDGGVGGAGGPGGRGGDGGPIAVTVRAPKGSGFARDVRAFLKIRSVGGPAGLGGAPGNNGSPGGAGERGRGGKGGDGGASAAGLTVRGTRGEDGDDGDSGSSGATQVHLAEAGKNGQSGAPRAISWSYR